MKQGQTAQQRLGTARAQRKGKAKSAPAAPAGVYMLPSPSAPLEVARCFIKAHCQHDNKPNELTLRFWCGSYWSWVGTHWADAEPHDVRARLYEFTDSAAYINAEMELVPWSPTRRKIDDLLDALKALILLPNSFEQPGWLDGRKSGPIVAVANGLLDVETCKLHPHTPLYFGQVAVQFPYDPDAPEPKRWNGFMDDLWPEEPEAIDVVGEWYGYVISGRTDLQKIFAMIGPTRGGKGIIARILTALIGKPNVCGPPLGSLATDRGLMPMIGKSLAVISDARGSAIKGASSVIVERLLSISGEDVLSIDRKYRDHWSGRLPTRLHIISNELPRLNDASGAIIGRLVLLLTTRSWLGKEDRTLEPALMTELPGILNFALAGLHRLMFENDGKFTRYAGADQAIAHMRDLASPVGAFVREMCVVEYGAEVGSDELYQAYKEWCAAGEFPKSPKTHFGRDLMAACPGVKKTRPWIAGGGKRPHVYVGIRLKEASDDEEPELSRSPVSSGESVVTDVTAPASGPLPSHDSHNENARGKRVGASAAAERANRLNLLKMQIKSDDLPYDGPVVGVPDMGPDELDEHGAAVTTESPSSSQPPLTSGRARELATWYLSDAAARQEASETRDPDQAGLDADLQAILRKELTSEAEVEAAIAQVMHLVFAI
jgi:putative DNA primase/helicase